MQEVTSSRTESDVTTSTPVHEEASKTTENGLDDSEKNQVEAKPDLPDVPNDKPAGERKTRKLSKGRNLSKKKAKRIDSEDPESSDSNSERRSCGGLDLISVGIAVVLGLGLIAVLVYFTVIEGILKKQTAVLVDDGITDSLDGVDLTTASGLIDFTDVSSTSATTRKRLLPSQMTRGRPRPRPDTGGTATTSATGTAGTTTGSDTTTRQSSGVPGNMLRGRPRRPRTTTTPAATTTAT
ncbi:uncharacterized protein LOC121378145 [Gigantopelta aegis]|uniref:uncharacterized protein LOC121378145 n=1 Tax=Gigantopelta aegis TaxID=1735272 RepID=UPI001B88AF94|nr:uncharacterized protein LOC121378145 [Gigantopelta aegis]